MKNYSDDLNIRALLELFKENKYEKTVACFKIIDHLDKIEIPKSINNWKIPLKSLYALSNGLVTYDYITEEQKNEYIEETKKLQDSSPVDENIDQKEV